MKKVMLVERLKGKMGKYGPRLKGNAAAVVTGQLLEIEFCDVHKYIELEDGDGYDGFALKDITFQLRGKTITIKKGEKIEIKSKSEFAKSKVVAYEDDKKRGNYQWLVIMVFTYTETRVAIIHHDEFNEKIIDVDGVGLSLNLDQTIQNNSVFTDLFLENEYLNYDLIAS
tara:strand:- start:46 stop:555 length:510 start_codon:yes stop_codon:yes gene_type:complete